MVAMNNHKVLKWLIREPQSYFFHVPPPKCIFESSEKQAIQQYYFHNIPNEVNIATIQGHIGRKHLVELPMNL